MMQNSAWNRYLELMKQRPEDFEDNGSIHIVTDLRVVQRYQEETGTVIGVCWESPWHILVTDLVWEQEGVYFPYERLLSVQPRGAVVCIPKCGEYFVLLRQYRHAVRGYQYAFPRGYGEAGLSAEENARKELWEELGARAKTVKRLGSVIADSGVSGTSVEIYLCEIDTYSQKTGYEGIAEVAEVDGPMLEDMIAKGQINDGFTLSAWSLLSCGN